MSRAESPPRRALWDKECVMTICAVGKEAEKRLNGDMYGMNYSGKDAEAFYVRTPYQKRVYNPAYYWFPIHQSEMDKNENLRQLPFWR